MREVITVTTLDRPDSATVLPEETATLMEVFVAGFQSAKTWSNYRANLRAWFGWADAGGVDGLAAQRAHVEAHIRHLEQCGYAPNTICQRVATLSSFYRWAVGEGQAAANPVEGARRPASPPSRRRTG
jgi:integrase/recombinase XerD